MTIIHSAITEPHSTPRWDSKTTKKAMADRCRQIAEKEIITEQDHDFLMSLLYRHPDYVKKAGAGVLFFTVRTTTFGSKGFYITRIDGSETDFSWVKCLRNPEHRSLVLSAMRMAVRDDVMAFKRHNIDGAICPITGESLTWENSHVDHASPLFVEIANNWAEQRGGFQELKLKPSVDNEIGRRLYDKDAEEFRFYHARVATLRLVTAYANLVLLRRP